MAVAAVGVVGDDDVGPQPADDGDELSDRLAHVGIRESLLVARLGARHAGVAPMSGAAKEIGLFDTEGVERLGELADAIPAELVGGVDRELGVAIADDFAFLTECAGDDVNLGAAGAVVGDGAAGRNRLVVRMGVDEEQARGFGRGHRTEHTVVDDPGAVRRARRLASVRIASARSRVGPERLDWTLKCRVHSSITPRTV